MVCHKVGNERNFRPRVGQGDLPELATYAVLAAKHFRSAVELWNARMPGYENLLLARFIGDPPRGQTIFDSIEDGDWSWLQRSRRYRNRETQQTIPHRKYLDLRDGFTDSLYSDVDAIGTELVEREITVHEYLRRMAKLIRNAHLGAWMLGGGGYNADTPSDVISLEQTLRVQYDYLLDFGRDIIEGNRPDLRQEQLQLNLPPGLRTLFLLSDQDLLRCQDGLLRNEGFLTGG